MILYDTIDELESYLGVFPDFHHVITVMDRSLPYDEAPGSYEVPEKKELKYKVEALLSSADGFTEKEERNRILEIVLEGEEMVSLDGGIFRLGAGDFLLYSDIDTVRRGIAYGLPSAFKTVRFLL